MILFCEILFYTSEYIVGLAPGVDQPCGLGLNPTFLIGTKKKCITILKGRTYILLLIMLPNTENIVKKKTAIEVDIFKYVMEKSYKSNTDSYITVLGRSQSQKWFSW